MIIAVASAIGMGKTYWIHQQIAQTNKPVGYFSPQTDSLPIDGIYLQSEYPQLKIYKTGEEANLLAESDQTIIYMEIPWYIELSGIKPLLKTLNSHRVGIIPANTNNIELKTWADEVLVLQHHEIQQVDKENILQIYRGVLTGEILDFDSLATFWLELTQGAYGEVVRAKGIFDLVDGQMYYGDFVSGRSQLEFKPLNLPRWLNGRPERNSGLEIVGKNLDRSAIAQTVKDCCVPESAIDYYQQQVKESSETEPEVEIV